MVIQIKRSMPDRVDIVRDAARQAAEQALHLVQLRANALAALNERFYDDKLFFLRQADDQAAAPGFPADEDLSLVLRAVAVKRLGDS